MAHRGRRSRIRSTSLACLIAEQASLDALYHCYAKHSARCLIESEGILHNGEQYLRQAGDVPDYYAHGYQEIDDCHHWNHRGRKLSHSLDTAEDDEQREQREHDAHGGRIDTEGLLPCQTDGVALHGIIGKTEGDDHQHGKEDTHPSLAQSILHIIGRSAIEGSLALALVKLGKRGFYEGRCGTQQSQHPHPEHGSRTTDADGCGHTRKITRTDSACQCHHECLEGRDVLHLAIHLHIHRQLILPYLVGLNLIGMEQQPHHLPDETKLNETGSPSEKHGTAYQNGNDDIRPEKIANLNKDVLN